MPTVELEELLAESEGRLCWLDRVHSLNLATAARTGMPPEDHDRQPERDALLADERVLSRLEHAYRHASPTTTLHRRCALWLSAALECRLAAESGQRRALRQMAALVDSFRGTVNRERHGLEGLRLVLRRDPSRSRREQAWEAMSSLAGLIEPYHREVIAGLAGAWAPGHGSQPVSFWDQPLSPFRLEWGDVDLPRLALGFLERTEHLVEQYLRLAARALRVRWPRAYDLDFAQLALSQNHESHFPPSDAAASVARGLRACGLPIDSLPLDPLLAPKWLPLDHAGWPPADWAAYAVPGEGARDDQPLGIRARVRPRVVVIADYRSGFQYGWTQLATATGAALAVLYGRGGYLAERRFPPRLDPGALIVADLATEPAWLAGQTAMARSDVPRYVTLGCLRSGLLHAVRVRALAARAIACWESMAYPQNDPSLAASEALASRTGVEGAGRLWALDFGTATYPAYRASLFLHELAAAQVRRYLRREHGRLMGDRRTGELLVECFWRQGAMVPLADAVRNATGEALSEAGLAEELDQATSA